MTNSSKMTISMWCRAHSTNAPSEGGDWYSLLEFGNPTGVLDQEGAGASNYIQLLTNCTEGNKLQFQFAAPLDGVLGAEAMSTSGSDPASGPLRYPSWSVDPYGTTGNPYTSGLDRFYTPYCNLITGSLGAVVDVEKWFHLLIAIDASHPSSFANPYNDNKAFVSINGFIKALKGEWDDSLRPSVTDGSFIPSMACRAPDPVFLRGPWEWTGILDDGSITSNGVVPAFVFDLSGSEIGLPSQRESPNLNSQLLDMADVQIWIGKFIDPRNSTNFSKLVEVVEGRGTPVNPEIAADYFGQQTYLFTGAREDFLINQGSGGAFSSSGTITDSSGVAY